MEGGLKGGVRMAEQGARCWCDGKTVLVVRMVEYKNNNNYENNENHSNKN